MAERPGGNAARGSGEGQALLPIPAPEELWCGADPALDPAARFEQFYRVAPIGERLFINSIVSGTQSSPSFYDGWKAQQVVDAAMEAASTQRWVEIEK